MNKFLENLKRQAEENPVVVFGTAALLLTAVSKLMDSNTQRSYAKTHQLEVARRLAMGTRK